MHLVTFERRIERERLGETTSMGDAGLGLEALDEVTHGARRLGALIEEAPHAGSIVDLNRALAIKLALDDSGAPEAEADSLLPPDARAFLRALPFSLEAARRALDFTLDSLRRYDAPDVLRAGVVEPARRVRLRAPVQRPGKLIAALPSDEAHDAPRFAVLGSSSVGDPGGDLAIPVGLGRVEARAALAVVIGSAVRRVGSAEALDAVAGYACAIDARARDLGEIGASCDGFTPLGPALVTADEVPDPQALSIRASVSGVPVQTAVTKEMPWPVAELISRVSRGMTLEPGDVLLAGAPEPRGEREPHWLRDGDVVEVEVERLGRLRSYVREAPSGA